MEIRYPEYYKQFRCLAGECPDTCCVAWEIRVDRETAGLYKELSKERNRLGRKLKARIRRGKIVPEGEFCPFLGVDHLCDIQRTHGEKALCRACRQYPRHTEDYGALQEMLLLMSCPEAARLILTGGEGFCLRKRPESKESAEKQDEGIDRELLQALLTVRERLFQILSDRRESWDFRLMAVLKICYEMQKQIEAGEKKQIEADLDAVIQKAAGGAAGRRRKRFWKRRDFLLWRTAWRKLPPLTGSAGNGRRCWSSAGVFCTIRRAVGNGTRKTGRGSLRNGRRQSSSGSGSAGTSFIPFS